MSPVLIIAFGALLVYLGIRVSRMKRETMPFLIAYPIFIAIVVGGGLVSFIGASYGAATLGLTSEDPKAMTSIFLTTGICLLGLWWVARRAIS